MMLEDKELGLKIAKNPEEVFWIDLKDKATKEIFDAVEQNKMKRQQIKDAENSLPNVPQGLSGKLKIEWMKRFDPNNPLMTDWQKIKAIGTDAQLLNTARTKGAISDKEMALFAQAAANDDLTSAARLKPILARLENAINADESARFGAYQQSYKEDPRKWFGQGSQDTQNDVNEEDIQFTMQKYGLSREEVLKRMQNA